MKVECGKSRTESTGPQGGQAFLGETKSKSHKGVFVYSIWWATGKVEYATHLESGVMYPLTQVDVAKQLPDAKVVC